MKNSRKYILLITLLIGAGLTKSTMAKQSLPDKLRQNEVSCQEALKNVNRIKVGMKASEVLELLGTPTAISGDNWGYNFMPCSPRPEIGRQTIIGIGMLFKEGIVSEIGWATICTMGIIPSAKKPKKKKSD